MRKSATPLTIVTIALALGLSACAGSPTPTPSPAVSTEAKPAKPGRAVLLTDLTLKQARQRIEAMDDDVDSVQSTFEAMNPEDTRTEDGVTSLSPNLTPNGWVTLVITPANNGPVRVTYVRINSI